MSNTKIYQKWCKNNFKIIVFSDNKKLSKAVLEQLQNHYRTNVSKHIAHALNLNLYTVRNWFYKGTGLKAHDLLCLLNHYECIRSFLGFRKILNNQLLSGKKNREEIRKKILKLLSDNPHMTMNELAIALEITPKSVEWKLYQLVKEKKIKRLGATKKGQWVAKKNILVKS